MTEENCDTTSKGGGIFCAFRDDGPVKSQKTPFLVIPAEAGIQQIQLLLDAGRRSRDQRGSSPE